MKGSTRDLGVVIVAAGLGERFGDGGKALAPLAGRPLLAWSLQLFTSISVVREIVVVAGVHTIDGCRALVANGRPGQIQVVPGGETRAESVSAGLAALAGDTRLAAVHDAARPLASRALVERVTAAARRTGAAVPALPVTDTLHLTADDGMIGDTIDRHRLWAAQTPQVARLDWLLDACRRAGGTTDEGGLLHAAGYPVELVDGDRSNLKITWPADIALAEAILTAEGLQP